MAMPHLQASAVLTLMLILPAGCMQYMRQEVAYLHTYLRTIIALELVKLYQLVYLHGSFLRLLVPELDRQHSGWLRTRTSRLDRQR